MRSSITLACLLTGIGPVTSYAAAPPRRPNDQQWRGMVWRDEVAQFKPAWARAYWSATEAKPSK